MPKILKTLSKKIVWIPLLIITSIFGVATLLYTSKYLTKHCTRPGIDCPTIEPLQPLPSTPVNYTTNCNLPARGDSAIEIRNGMTALYACSVQSHLEKYKDAKISLQNPKTQRDLIQELFEKSEIPTNKLIYDSGNWQLYFWSPEANQKFQTENYQVHGQLGNQHKTDIEENYSSGENLDPDTNKMSMARPPAPTREVLLNQPKLVISSNGRFEDLNYKHLLAITGFSTETEMLDFVLIQNKLLSQGSKFGSITNTELDPFNRQISQSTPLLFLQDYQFSNKNDNGTFKFGCGRQEYTGNLKVMINLDKKEIQYFAHPTQNSLSKIKIWLDNSEPRTGPSLRFENQRVLDCDSMVIC